MINTLVYLLLGWDVGLTVAYRYQVNRIKKLEGGEK
jgi:hypothetical protein